MRLSALAINPEGYIGFQAFTVTSTACPMLKDFHWVCRRHLVTKQCRFINVAQDGLVISARNYIRAASIAFKATQSSAICL